MFYNGFVRVDKKYSVETFWWFIDNGFVASIPLSLSPYSSEIFISDVTPDQRILCTDYLSSVYGVFPYFYCYEA